MRAADQRAWFLWGAAMLLCFGAVIAIKIWYWLEMNRLALTREVKRLELLVAQIARRLDDKREAPRPEPGGLARRRGD